jgi:Predicted integral membrane protein (DUF2269)
MYGWIVFLHVLGAFTFVLGHGASMIVAFRLRGQRDMSQIRELLAVSQIGLIVTYVGLLVLLAAGILAGFVGGHWGRLWIWVSLGILLVVSVAMYIVATPHYGRMRAAAAAPGYEKQAAKFKPPASPDQLPALADSSRPFLLAVVGGIGLIAIVYLMLFQPF